MIGPRGWRGGFTEDLTLELSLEGETGVFQRNMGGKGSTARGSSSGQGRSSAQALPVHLYRGSGARRGWRKAGGRPRLSEGPCSKGRHLVITKQALNGPLKGSNQGVSWSDSCFRRYFRGLRNKLERVRLKGGKPGERLSSSLAQKC